MKSMDELVSDGNPIEMGDVKKLQGIIEESTKERPCLLWITGDDRVRFIERCN